MGHTHTKKKEKNKLQLAFVHPYITILVDGAQKNKKLLTTDYVHPYITILVDGAQNPQFTVCLCSPLYNHPGRWGTKNPSYLQLAYVSSASFRGFVYSHQLKEKDESQGSRHPTCYLLICNSLKLLSVMMNAEMFNHLENDTTHNWAKVTFPVFSVAEDVLKLYHFCDFNFS